MNETREKNRAAVIQAIAEQLVSDNTVEEAAKKPEKIEKYLDLLPLFSIQYSGAYESTVRTLFSEQGDVFFKHNNDAFLATIIVRMLPLLQEFAQEEAKREKIISQGTVQKKRETSELSTLSPDDASVA